VTFMVSRAGTMVGIDPVSMRVLADQAIGLVEERTSMRRYLAWTDRFAQSPMAWLRSIAKGWHLHGRTVSNSWTQTQSLQHTLAND